MRIGLDAFPLTQPYGGIGTYVRHLLDGLSRAGSDHEFVAYVPARATLPSNLPPAAAGGSLSYRGVGGLGYRWRGRLDGLDLFHGTNFKLQTQGRFGGILTIHDCWLDRHPEHGKKLLGQRLSFYRTRRRTRRAKRVIAVSRHTAREVEELYGVPSERIAVVHHGVSPRFYPDADPEAFARLRARLGLPGEPYLLFVGGAAPRKNHETLWRAYAQQARVGEAYRLVAVGNPRHRSGSLQATADRLGIGHRVVVTGPVPADDLRLLYSHADCFVFPSRHEGFGFPVLEAMACGAPVVTSRTTSLPEIAGDAALLVDPTSAEEMGEAIRRVLSDAALGDRLRQRGFARAKQFTWEAAARRTLQVYKEACESD